MLVPIFILVLSPEALEKQTVWGTVCGLCCSEYLRESCVAGCRWTHQFDSWRPRGVTSAAIGRQFGKDRGKGEGRRLHILARAVAYYLLDAGKRIFGQFAHYPVAPRAAVNAVPASSANLAAVGCSVSNGCVRATSLGTFLLKRSLLVSPAAPRPKTGYVNARPWPR
jgi:hypothetical protein